MALSLRHIGHSGAALTRQIANLSRVRPNTLV